MPVNAIPDGYRGVTPYLIVKNAAAAIDFYKQAFAAEELHRMPMPGGKIGHADLTIAGAHVMLADEMPEHGALSPESLNGSPVGLLLYVNDVDARFNQAIAAGAKVLRAVQDQFYGDRSGTLMDPFGHKWTLATHVEDVPVEEMQRRMKQWMQQGGCAEEAGS